METSLGDFSQVVERALRERDLTLIDLAQTLPPDAVLVDFAQYQRWDYNEKSKNWKEQRYVAYLTFPLSHDSTNVVVERVDLGEAAPINDAVELICKRMSAGQFAAKDLAVALQRLSNLVYAPLAKHLTNISHLILCPDGQLSRLPFEMLPVGNKFLVEEKTISYVTSGREVVRLAGGQANSKLKIKNAKSLVMGNPDFDLDLGRSRRREEAEVSLSSNQPANSEGVRLLTSAATRSLSRDFRGLKFNPLPGSGVEATNVAKLLGNDTVLRLGAEAREADLKTVQSPRVLHLATHGFFLTDQDGNRETRGIRETGLGLSTGGTTGTPFSRGSHGSRFQDWENPLVRCGIALAGANHTNWPTGRSSRREEAQTSNSQLSTNDPQPTVQSLLTSAATRFDAEDGILTGLEASLLNLQGTELVILSACDSGSGEVKIGEGVMSLRRAFRIAGAETVLASHWKVSDKATSQLMTEFMRRWRSGEPRAKAWREAQLTLLRSKGTKEDFSNPYFWAAFTLTGQWN